MIKWRLESEVAFLIYDAVKNLHSLSYGNFSQGNKA